MLGHTASRGWEGHAIDQKAALGSRIKALRRQRGLSQEQLASKADITAQYVSNIERGRENPTLDLLLRLAAALRVSPVDVFDFDAQALDRRTLQAEIRKLTDTQDLERLRLAVKLLRAVLR